MNLTELANETADMLERQAEIRKNNAVTRADAEYAGYTQACEDFAKAIRSRARELTETNGGKK